MQKFVRIAQKPSNDKMKRGRKIEGADQRDSKIEKMLQELLQKATSVNQEITLSLKS